MIQTLEDTYCLRSCRHTNVKCIHAVMSCMSRDAEDELNENWDFPLVERALVSFMSVIRSERGSIHHRQGPTLS